MPCCFSVLGSTFAINQALRRNMPYDALSDFEPVCLGGYSVSLGQFSAAAIDRASHLATGLPLAFFAGKSAAAREVDVLVQRLARGSARLLARSERLSAVSSAPPSDAQPARKSRRARKLHVNR